MKAILLTLAVAAASVQAAPADASLRLRRGHVFLKRAAATDKTSVFLRNVRRARWYFRTSRKLARRHGLAAVERRATTDLVVALNRETAHYVARGSLRRAANRNRRALSLLADNARARRLRLAIRDAMGADAYANGGNEQLERMRRRRPIRDRGRARRR